MNNHAYQQHSLIWSNNLSLAVFLPIRYTQINQRIKRVD